MCKEILYDYMNERHVLDITAVHSKVFDLGYSLSGGMGWNRIKHSACEYQFQIKN